MRYLHGAHAFGRGTVKFCVVEGEVARNAVANAGGTHGKDFGGSVTRDHYSDTSILSDEERELVAKMRADTELWRDLPAEQRSKLAPDKQSFPIGIRPDGTVNRVDEVRDRDES